MTHSWVNFPGVLDDDWNGQIDVVRVDQAHSEACKARKGPMHRPLSQHLHDSTAVALILLTRRLPVLSVKPEHVLCTISIPAAAHDTATHCCTLQIRLCHQGIIVQCIKLPLQHFATCPRQDF